MVIESEMSPDLKSVHRWQWTIYSFLCLMWANTQHGVK